MYANICMCSPILQTIEGKLGTLFHAMFCVCVFQFMYLQRSENGRKMRPLHIFDQSIGCSYLSSCSIASAHLELHAACYYKSMWHLVIKFPSGIVKTRVETR